MLYDQAAMDACKACAEPLSESQHSCPSQGGATQRVELIDAAAPVVSEQTVSRVAGVNSKWYIAIGGLLTLMIGWSILSSGTNDQPADDGETEVAEQTTTSESDVAPDGEPEEGEDEPEPSTTETSTKPSTTDTPTSDDQDAALSADASIFLDNGPLNATGLTLVIGDPIKFLDLDTGEVTETTHRNVVPIAVIGERLIVNSVSSGNNLRAIDLNDLEAEAVDFESPNGLLFAFTVGDDPNTIVAIGDNFNGGPLLSRYVYDGETGTITDEQLVSIDVGFFGGWIGVGDFTTPRAGGVYRSDGDRYQLVGPGRVVAQGDGLVLVEECDTALQCVFGWRDAGTYEPRDLPVPAGISDGRVFADGRLLVFRSMTSWQGSILDLETGELIATDLDEVSSWLTTASPDNEMLAYGRNGSVFLLELDTGIEHRVMSQSASGGFFNGQLLMKTR